MEVHFELNCQNVPGVAGAAAGATAGAAAAAAAGAAAGAAAATAAILATTCVVAKIRAVAAAATAATLAAPGTFWQNPGTLGHRYPYVFNGLSIKTSNVLVNKFVDVKNFF